MKSSDWLEAADTASVLPANIAAFFRFAQLALWTWLAEQGYNEIS